MKSLELPKFHWAKILSAFFFILLLGAYANIFAIGQKYNPGETLDPACPPGEINCTVDIGGGGSSQWTTTGSDIYYNSGSVGIGTNTPDHKLTVYGGDNYGEYLRMGNGLFSWGEIGEETYFNISKDNELASLSAGAGISLGDLENSFLGTKINIDSLNGNINLLNGNIGIGTTSPTSTLDIRVGNPTINIDQGFNGLGLNDATFSGTYNKSYNDVIYVQIDSEGDPDTFSYYDDIGSCEVYNIPITGSPQEICNGLSIAFASTTGHTLSDQWHYQISLSSSVTSTNPVINISDGVNNYFTVNAVVPNSIFLGTYAGQSAISAYSSNFFGEGAGESATSAYSSNFLGSSAGGNATNASSSNFLGSSAGGYATNAYNSNFFGFSSGEFATNAYDSNFLGYQAGVSAATASNSNFFGNSAGRNATNAFGSNFLGQSAGVFATIAYNSNFLGSYAGESATNANNSNFFGTSAGNQATNASVSNFIGGAAGFHATNAANSIFIGQNAGYNDIVNNTSNGLTSILIGSFTNTGGFSNSILLGSGTSGLSITNTKANQFMLAPSVTEMRLRGVDYSLPSSQGGASTVLTNNGSGVLSWTSAGGGSPITVVNTSNLFSTGLTGTGSGVTSVNYSNFFGINAGYQATSASDSNFLGFGAGYQATNASNSNFFSRAAGYQATNASNSNFLGFAAGFQATDAANSNFLGFYAGSYIAGAANSNFFGTLAGNSTINASYSNLFGYQAGKTFGSNNIGPNNIIIGTNITLPNATANAINLGGVLFATGTYATTTGNPSITAVTSGKVGIAVVSPSYTLQVGNSSVSGIVARFENSSGTCDINPTTSSVGCSSDITLKKNIIDLNKVQYSLKTVPDMTNVSTLDKVLTLTPVEFNWNNENDTDSKHIGFIAQEMEQIFPSLVSTDPDTGLKSIAYANITPYLVKAIQEMDLKLNNINNLEIENTLRDNISAWFANAENHITRIFTGEICLTEAGQESECINRSELKSLKALLNNTQITSIPQIETCSDGIMNQDETSIDTGGVCPPAIETTPEVVTPPSTLESPVVQPIIPQEPVPPAELPPQ